MIVMTASATIESAAAAMANLAIVVDRKFGMPVRMRKSEPNYCAFPIAIELMIGYRPAARLGPEAACGARWPIIYLPSLRAARADWPAAVNTFARLIRP